MTEDTHTDQDDNRRALHLDSNVTGTEGNGAGPAYELEPDVDTGPDTEEATDTSKTGADKTKAKAGRFNLDEDALGPDQTIHQEKSDPIAIEFGDPKDTEWFRIDPRPGRSARITFIKAKVEGADRGKLFYVPKGARDIPEIAGKLKNYTVHAVQKKVGPATFRTAIWPRRHATAFKGGGEDVWGATDAVVAERAAKEWVRREKDPNVPAGWHTVPVPKDKNGVPLEPPPNPPFDDRPLNELLELAIPPGDVIEDDSHPLIQFLRYGR